MLTKTTFARYAIARGYVRVGEASIECMSLKSTRPVSNNNVGYQGSPPDQENVSAAKTKMNESANP